MNEELALRLLWLGVENTSGLWEAAREVEVMELTIPYSEACLCASRLLQELHRRGFILAYRGPEPIDTDELVPLAGEEFSQALNRSESWATPEDSGDVAVRYDTTAEGFRWYRDRRGWTH